MAENRMAAVAALFGKELGESFEIKFPRKLETYYGKFEQSGLMIAGWDGIFICPNPWILEALLTGEAVIVDERK